MGMSTYVLRLSWLSGQVGEQELFLSLTHQATTCAGALPLVSMCASFVLCVDQEGDIKTADSLYAHWLISTDGV